MMAGYILVRMKLAKYWTRQPGEAVDGKGQHIRVTARGWSNESMESAAAVARDVARRIAERIVSDRPKAPPYPYGDRPLPEPVLQEFRNGAETPKAVVTRNIYGARVLNTRDLMFVDIDRQETAPKPAESHGLLRSLFGKSKTEASSTPPPTDPAVTAIHNVAERHHLAGRIYKTAAGYRVLVLNRRLDPNSAETEALLREFGSDALYIRLCKLQESFRARLTPKPWRCGLAQPPVTFPFAGPKEEAIFREWDAKYAAKSASYATCKFLGTFGAGGVESGFEELVQHHDRETKATSALPLA